MKVGLPALITVHTCVLCMYVKQKFQNTVFIKVCAVPLDFYLLNWFLWSLALVECFIGSRDLGELDLNGFFERVIW